MQGILMAEDDFKLTWSRALMHERRAIMSISKSGRASVLEEVGVGRWLASLWAVEMISATELVGAKGLTTTLATHHMTTCPTVLQVLRTCCYQICFASHHRTVPSAFMRSNSHGDIKSIN